ncbi:hypothetical protein [Nocardioides sp. URHA0020]|uniref:hypothetical protein n=1 Tax=Nocardioides sp. URHA0020 TaxID=1380392 RepID=UPI00056ABC67|nr:hypothetical protein [Nocardioides sp. URHA0020]
MRRRQRAVLAGLALVTVAMAASAGPSSALTHQPDAHSAPYRSAPGPQTVGRAAVSDEGWKQTKSVQRSVVDNDGSTRGYPFTDPFKVTVDADHTKNLRGRERIAISWKGAQPSAGRASDPYGVGGLNQEYPVVIMQCRGAGASVTPETCWTSSFSQRSQVSRSASDATWTHDRYADPADKEKVSGPADFPTPAQCPSILRDGDFYTHLTPFVSKKGKVYSACDKDHMPPEAAAEAAFPAAEIASYTDTDGNGSAQFEVRSDVENESLGCNDTTACSIVVVPITGVSCDQASAANPTNLTPVEKSCRKTGQWAPGSSNFVNLAVDQAVSPALWWSESNWRNRFVIPITFGLPPDTCDILDPRAPTGFYGSELLSQAALQWSPAYCLNKKRFKFQLNQMPDEAGWNLMRNGEGAAAEVSSEHPAGTDPVGYAPTAVTGFGISYLIDRPDNAGEYTRLRLNARLVAKLLTQSYLGSGLGKDHPGIGSNPWGIMADPEFVRLNPGLSQNASEAGASLLSLSNSSDIIEQLTSWIAQDAEATAFIRGKADPWGMKVNPSYRNITLPTAEWPLLDTFVPQTSIECWDANPPNYFSLLAAPVTTLSKIATALLDSWPNTQTRCDTDVSTSPHTYKVGRVDRQSYGARFMLGIVSLGDAARYGLRTSALETRKGTYVAPTDRSLSAALRLSKQQQKYGPFVLDQADVRRSRTAYPGAMVVYTAARLQNLPKKDAAKVAKFIRVSTSEGQRPGSGNGELPQGFLPIRRSGVTARYYASAQTVADAVEAQRKPAAEPTAKPSPSVDGSGGDGSGVGAPVTPPDAAPGDPAPSVAPSPSVSPSAPTAATPMPATQSVGSDLAGGLLPALILLGAIGCASTALLRAGAPFLRGRR